MNRKILNFVLGASLMSTFVACEAVKDVNRKSTAKANYMSINSADRPIDECTRGYGFVQVLKNRAEGIGKFEGKVYSLSTKKDVSEIDPFVMLGFKPRPAEKEKRAAYEGAPLESLGASLILRLGSEAPQMEQLAAVKTDRAVIKQMIKPVRTASEEGEPLTVPFFQHKKGKIYLTKYDESSVTFDIDDDGVGFYATDEESKKGGVQGYRSVYFSRLGSEDRFAYSAVPGDVEGEETYDNLTGEIGDGATLDISIAADPGHNAALKPWIRVQVQNYSGDGIWMATYHQQDNGQAQTIKVPTKGDWGAMSPGSVLIHVMRSYLTSFPASKGEGKFCMEVAAQVTTIGDLAAAAPPAE